MPLVALAPASGSQDIDRYELLFRFAAGGMAEVFVARQRGTGGFVRPIAVKRMLPALAEEPRFVEMFLDEARLAALVQSPYVVPTLDCGKDEEGSPYIVMELVVGVSLAQALRGTAERKGQVPPGIMAEIIAQTALGLYDAHHARTPTGQPLEIVHRDVSPQNVLVGVDGRARLTDFGVARALERVSRTSTGEVKGKLSYFSPEQARMEVVDQRSDIFALGVVAWEALTLERLFSRDNPVASLQAVLHERIPDVRESNPDLPEKLANVVARALERDLSKRYQNARQFADELRASVDAPATATELGLWIEQAGGPRLAAFRKRIESAFGEADTEVRVVTESPSGRALSTSAHTPSHEQRALFGQGTPLSYVVGEARTAPDEARVEGTVTKVASAPGNVTRVIQAPAREEAGDADAASIAAATTSSSEESSEPAPLRPAMLVAAGVLLVLVATAAYLLGGGAPEAPPRASTAPRTTGAPRPPEAVVEAPTTSPALEPPPVAPPPVAAHVPPRGERPRPPSTAATSVARDLAPSTSPVVHSPERSPTAAVTPDVAETAPVERPTVSPPSETVADTVAPEAVPPETGRLRVGTGATRLRGAGP